MCKIFPESTEETQIVRNVSPRAAGEPGGNALASVRDPSALDRLPDNERAAWQALWSDVEELMKRTAKLDKVSEKPEKQEEAKQPKKRGNK